MTRTTGTVTLGDTEIEFTISRSRNRKTVAITVLPDQSVSVIAPSRIRKQRIEAAVKRKSVWILNQKERIRRQQKAFPRLFVSGESFYYLGRQYRLKVMADTRVNGRAAVRLLRGQFRVDVSFGLSGNCKSQQAKNALICWYRDRAKERLPRIADRYARRLGVSYETLRIKEMRQRWGSGGKSGRLAFNWRIMMAPIRLIEYVVAHELCHLKYDDHSRDFWRLLEKLVPDCQRRRIRLELTGPKFDLQGCEIG